IEANLASLGIHADREQIMSIFVGCSQPYLATHYHRRGPATVRNGGFPPEVFGLAPVQRKAQEFGVPGSGDVAVAPEAAKFGPVRPRGSKARGQDQRNQG